MPRASDTETGSGPLPAAHAPALPLVVEVSAVRALRLLSVLAAVLVVLGVAVHALTGPTDSDNQADGLRGAVRLLALDTERNLPTLFSTLLIVCCAAVAAWCASCLSALHAPLVGRWRLIALGFLALAVDEAAGIHEVAPAVLRRMALDGVDAAAIWAVLAAAGLSAATLLVLPVLRAMPSPVSRRWVLAGGALALAVCADLVGPGPRTWAGGFVGSALVGVEEGLELTAFLVLLAALRRSLQGFGTVLRLTTDEEPAPGRVSTRPDTGPVS